MMSLCLVSNLLAGMTALAAVDYLLNPLVLISAGLAAVLVLACWLRPRWLRLKAYMKQLRTPGFVPPPPTVRAMRWQLRLTKFFTWIFVGKVKVVGMENLAKLPVGTSYQITPNHSHFADIFLVPMILNERRPRCMADPAVMGGLGGLFGLLVAPMGGFAASRTAAAEILRSGQPMLIFPEGWTYLDGNMGLCRKGAVHFSRQTAAALQQTSYLLPMYVKYGRYPGPWIMKLPIRVQYAILFFGFIGFRCGATVVIGAPIPNTALPDNDTEASAMLRQEILNLKP